MHGEIKPVDRQRVTQHFEELGLEGVVGWARHGAAGHGAGMQKRQMLDTLGLHETEVLGVQQRLAAQNAKIFLCHQNRRIGAAFGMDATNGDAHERSSQRFGLSGAMAAKRSQSFADFGVHAASAIAGSRGKTSRLK